MKTTSDHLFKLIKSLTGHEKGYFKKYANFHVRNNQNNYTKLFDAIDLQEEYNEKDLFKTFKNERLINNFSVAKNYLYDTILESLESYHKNSNAEIRSLLNKTEILVDKGLYKQARKLLKSAHEIALSNEKFGYISEINALEHTISRQEFNTEEIISRIDKSVEEMKYAARQIDTIAEYERIRNKMFLQIIGTGNVRNTSDMNNYSWILKEPLLQDAEKSSSVTTKSFYYGIYALYYSWTSDHKKCYETSLVLAKIVHENANVFKENIDFNSRGLYLLTIQCINLGKFDEALRYISQIEKQKPRGNLQRSNLLLKTLNLKFDVYFKRRSFKKCLEMIPEVEQFLEKNSHTDKFIRYSLYGYVTYSLMVVGDFKQALKWMVKGNISNTLDSRQDLECIMRIMELVLYYELDKTDVLEFRIKSTYRFIAGKQKLYEIEKVILEFMRKLPRVNTEPNTLQFFKQLKKSLDQVMKDPLEKNFLYYFDIMSWLESKTENKKFIDVLKSKRISNLAPSNDGDKKSDN